MPSKVFFNLKEEKKERILKSAIDEFSKCIYEEVQVKRIVESAGIARGSFYQYFEDIEDLLRYLLIYMKKIIVENQEKDILIDTSNEPFEILRCNFIERIKSTFSSNQGFKEKKLMNMIRNSETALKIFIDTLGIIPRTGNDQLVQLFVNFYKEADKKRVELLLSMLFTTLIPTIEMFLRKELSEDEAIEEINFKFQVIQTGANDILNK